MPDPTDTDTTSLKEHPLSFVSKPTNIALGGAAESICTKSNHSKSKLQSNHSISKLPILTNSILKPKYLHPVKSQIETKSSHKPSLQAIQLKLNPSQAKSSLKTSPK